LNIEMSAEWHGQLREVGRTCEPVLYQHAGPAVIAVGMLQIALCSSDSLQHLGVEEAVVSLIDSLCTSEARVGGSKGWLMQVEELIRCSLGEGLSLSEISGAIGVHPSHLCREFRRAFGCTMTQYAARLRADLALEQIIASTSPLASIAVQAG